MSLEEIRLLRRIAQNIEARGTRFAMLIPPPRSVVAGQMIVEETSQTSDLGLQELAADFNGLMAQIQTLGIPAPNLLSISGEGFYFQRDTHWTPLGAARSVLALSSAMDFVPPHGIDDLEIVGTDQQQGSLMKLVNALCDTNVPGESYPVYDYAAQRAEAFDGVSSRGTLALVGSSFSNAFRRDAYQVGPALEAATNLDVLNHGWPGGGMVGPMETYFLTGAYQQELPDWLVWEFPYTGKLREAQLRQVLGALRARPDLDHEDLPLVNGNLITEVPPETTLIGVKTYDPTLQELKVRIWLSNGEIKVLSLKRAEAMLDHIPLDVWWVDLSNLEGMEKLRIEVRGSQSNGARVWLH